MHSATFRLSPEDYAAYNQRFCARRLGRILAIVVVLLAILTIAADGIEGLKSTFFGSLVGFALLATYIFVLIPRQSKGIYREQPSMSEPRALTINAESVEFNQPSGTFRTNWTDVLQWDETPRLLILFVNRAMFIPITKAEIGAEMTDNIRALLVQSGLPVPRRKRARS